MTMHQAPLTEERDAENGIMPKQVDGQPRKGLAETSLFQSFQWFQPIKKRAKWKTEGKSKAEEPLASVPNEVIGETPMIPQQNIGSGHLHHLVTSCKTSKKSGFFTNRFGDSIEQYRTNANDIENHNLSSLK